MPTCAIVEVRNQTAPWTASSRLSIDCQPKIIYPCQITLPRHLSFPLVPPSGLTCAIRAALNTELADKHTKRDVLEAYCQRHGLHLALVFADVHKSGTSDEREQFYETMDMTVQERLRPDGLLIWSFARNTLDAQYHKEKTHHRHYRRSLEFSFIIPIPGPPKKTSS